MVAGDLVAGPNFPEEALAPCPEDAQNPGEGEAEAILIIADEDEEVVLQFNEDGELEEIKTVKRLKREDRNRGP